MTEFMTLEEVAGYLRVTKKTIYRSLERKDIPATKVGHLWRFNKTSIDKWLGQSSINRVVNILVIDDDEAICSLFKDTLENVVNMVTTVSESFKGLKLVKSGDYDLVFLDLMMPVMNGSELFREIRAVKPELPVTIITGYPDSALMSAAMAYGPFGVMRKPFSVTDIMTVVKSYLRVDVPTR